MRILFAVWVCLLVCLSGCSSSSFLGSRFDNFSAYYNKFYNAERSLKEGIRNIEQQRKDEPIDQNVFIPLFGRNQHTFSQQSPFEDAISKSADIVRKHPNSKWVDDAIMTIGKAWFYTQNYVGAEEKFNELLDIDSPLRDEANFWLARTLFASEAYEDAVTHLQALLSTEDLSSRWEPYYRLILAELYIHNQSFEQATVELELGLKKIRDSQLASRSQFLQGQALEQIGRYEEAVAAYDRVQRYSPFYELSYAAQFNAVRVHAIRLDPLEAMSRLRRMERDDKNYDYRAELDYLRGRVLIAMGLYDDALTVYDELLYEPTADGSRVRGRVHYALATFYRDIVVDYPYAAAHFDTAASSIRTGDNRRGISQSSSKPLPPSPSAITDSQEQAEIYGDFSDAFDRIILMDSLLYLGTLDDSSFAVVVLELRKQRAEELAELERQMRQRQSESGFRRNAPGIDDGGYGETAVAGSEGEAGFLFHKDSQQMLYAREDFISIWGPRPLAPNWRRIAAIVESVAGESDTSGETIETENATINLPRVDVSAVPRTEQAFEAMLTERAYARYELANVLFLSMNMPDSAAVWYRVVIEDNIAEDVVKRAYYALAEVQQALGDTLAAHRLYEIIITNYPQSELTGQAYLRLDRPVSDLAAMDSSTIAERNYKNYQLKWQEGVSEEIISDMLNLGLNWHQTSVAPRALLASSQAFLELATSDSLDVLAPIPVSVNDSLLEVRGFYSRFDSTATASDSMFTLPLLLTYLRDSYGDYSHAGRAGRILSALQEEEHRRQAIRDSVQQVADSLTETMLTDSLVIDDSLQFSIDVPDSLLISDTVTDSLSRSSSIDSLNAELDFLEPIGLEAPLVQDTSMSVNTTESMNLSEIESDSLETIQLDDLLSPDQIDISSNSDNKTDPSLGNIDWSKGGYTIHLISYDDHETAQAFVINFSRQLSDLPHALDIYGAEVQDAVEFRIGLGLFETLQEAESVKNQLDGRIPFDSVISRIRAADE